MNYPSSVLEINASHCDQLEKHLRLQTFPLAIRMWPHGEALPERARRPRRDLGIQVATCQVFGMARRYGWSFAITLEDLACPLTIVAFGFEEAPDDYLAGCACEGMYTETREAGARTESMVARWDKDAYQAIVVAPLRRANFTPDVILLFGTPGQVLRCVTAALWKEGGYLESRFSGRLDCSDQVIHTMKTGKCQVILPCYGDRIFGHAEDHEMAFTIPGPRMNEFIEGLEGTHRGGVRYPIPVFLRYTPVFPESYERIARQFKKRRGEEQETSSEGFDGSSTKG